jgi:serine/threonine-protein kinase RIO1
MAYAHVAVWVAGFETSYQVEVQSYRRLAEFLTDSGSRNVDSGVLTLLAAEWPCLLLNEVGERVEELLTHDVSSLVAAIRTIHSAGVIHNDLRLSNLIRVRGAIQIIDFTAAV